jgi:hypothetical protein
MSFIKYCADAFIDVFFRVQLPAALTSALGGRKSAAMLITRVVSAFWHVRSHLIAIISNDFL